MPDDEFPKETMMRCFHRGVVFSVKFNFFRACFFQALAQIGLVGALRLRVREEESTGPFPKSPKRMPGEA